MSSPGKRSVRRPDVFSQEKFEQSLVSQGCTKSFVAPVTSDYRLIVPLALAKLGVDGIVDLLNENRSTYGLNEQEDLWRTAATYAVGWATGALQEYREAKTS
jgi:hypothetical protein